MKTLIKYKLNKETMKNLQNQINTIITITQEKEIVSFLQKINQSILTHYRIKIDNDLYLYPTEVEAYYLDESKFNDECVHNNPLQRNRFGKIYLHRRKKDNNTISVINGNRGGVDICLSNGNYALGILIRSVRLNFQTTICGPGRLFKYLAERYGLDVLTNKIEQEALLEKIDSNDPRDKSEIILAKREGITKGIYKEELLRSLIELRQNTNIKGKENIVRSYLKMSGEKVTDNRIEYLLGYKSKSLLEYFNNN